MDGARAKSAVQHCDIITWWSFEEETGSCIARPICTRMSIHANPGALADDTPFKLHFRMGIRTKKCKYLGHRLRNPIAPTISSSATYMLIRVIIGVNRRLHWAGAPDFVHCSSKKRIDPGVDHTQREHKHKDRKHGGGDYGDEEDDEYDSDSDYE